MANYAVIESTIEFMAGQYRVRTWRDEKEVKDFVGTNDIEQWALTNTSLPLGAFAEGLAKLDRVNAVHVIGPDGRGLVLYNNW